MSGTNSYIERLLLSHLMTEPVIRKAIGALNLPPGSRGLDVGCGIGLHLPIMAEAVGEGGCVIGLDLSSDFLVRAEEIAKECGYSGRVTLKTGDVNVLPFDDNTFDWVWSANLVGYHPALKPIMSMGELVRVVRPGGTVAIIYWSSQQLLCGHPMLEARLNATTPGIAPFTTGMSPDSHSQRGLGWFRVLGLMDVRAFTFVGDVRAPLSDEMKDAMVSLFEMRWGEAKSEVSHGVWNEYHRLCQPESVDFILNHKDYYAFFTYTMFTGVMGE
jgi:demethylmenaquinone methyltransferase / 2-methoxy-6-polyprenyl-1,4-benzoquinol methylase